MHRFNSYITLTYDDEHLPPNNSLRHEDFVLFMKKLRNAIARQEPDAPLRGLSADRPAVDPAGVYQVTLLTEKSKKVRFYMAGEYGDIHGRPHYHALLFGVEFADKRYHGRTKAGEKIYRSETLKKLWPHGYSSIGAVSFNSAAYIARYVLKKRTGDGERNNYKIINPETGQIYEKKKEYNCMSRATGIGKSWWTAYNTDVSTQDQVVLKNGNTIRPPRYYDKQLQRKDPELYELTKLNREIQAKAKAADRTDERLAAQERVANAQHRHQTRNLH